MLLKLGESKIWLDYCKWGFENDVKESLTLKSAEKCSEFGKFYFYFIFWSVFSVGNLFKNHSFFYNCESFEILIYF